MLMGFGPKKDGKRRKGIERGYRKGRGQAFAGTGYPDFNKEERKSVWTEIGNE